MTPGAVFEEAKMLFPRVRKCFSSMNEKSRFLLVILPVLIIAACKSAGSSPPSSNDYTAFSNQEPVTISGYGGDAMEPFISRDGAFLFFNNNAGGPADKDLFYAAFVNGTTFQYKGAITAANSTTVDGAPALDDFNKIFYVSLVNYDASTNFDTLYSGTWDGSTVTGSAPLDSLTIAMPFILYFDIEVSPDGSTLYLSRGDFTAGGGFPSTADIVIAVNPGGGFTLDPDSDSIMVNVNTSKLEYAPAISADGLELFFTRYDPGAGSARIYRAARSNTGSAFGMPQLVSAITGFVEGPAFSPDEKSLYYHRLNTVTNRFEIYRVTRP
jgi:hypothetical protein